jgi:hypothetical protein
METDNLTNPWPNVPHTTQNPLPNTLSFSSHSKETVASVNAFLLKMSIDIAQENVNAVRNGNRADLTFEAKQNVIRTIAKFFNPTWKQNYDSK